jgi:hypothetical protein
MLEDSINSKHHIKQIHDNLVRSIDELKKKATEKNKLVYKKTNSTNNNENKNTFNIFESYSEIENSFHNRLIRFGRFLSKLLKIIFYTFLILSPILTTLVYFYQFELLILFTKFNINTSYLINFINVIDKLFLFFNEYYQSIIIYFSELDIKNN